MNNPAIGNARVSAVIAAFNEATSISHVIEGVRENTTNLDEIIVIDDGSTDDTQMAAESSGARVVRFTRNRGKGQALIQGIREAAGDILLFIDADGQDDPAEIPILLNAMNKDVAMVIGSRFIGTLYDGAITKLNHAGNQAITECFNILFDSHLTDTQAGFRLLRRSALDPSQLKATRYEIETEITMAVLARGGKIVEVPVSRYQREGGQSGFVPFYHGSRILLHMMTGRLWRHRI